MIKVAATAFSIICPQEIKSYLHCLSRFIIIYSLIIPSHLLPRDGLSLGSVQCQFQAPTYYAVTCSWPFISRALVLLGLFGRGERTDGNGNQCWGNKPLGVDTISSHRPEKWFAKYTQSFQANAVQINSGEIKENNGHAICKHFLNSISLHKMLPQWRYAQINERNRDSRARNGSRARCKMRLQRKGGLHCEST